MLDYGLGMDEQLEFLKQVASRLDGAGIPYMITGSTAMAMYGVPRMTRDIDVVVEYGREDTTRIAALFEADCYVDREAVRDAAVRRSLFNIIHKQWITKADFIVRKDEEYRRVEFARRRRMDIGGSSASVVAPEDLILSKLHWARDSGSETQIRDAKAVVAGVPALDWAYLQTWAAELGVEDLLDEVRET